VVVAGGMGFAGLLGWTVFSVALYFASENSVCVEGLERIVALGCTDLGRAVAV